MAARRTMAGRHFPRHQPAHEETRMSPKRIAPLWIPFVVCLVACGWTAFPVTADPASLTAFKHVNLVPMTREIVLPDRTVLVQGKTILAAGPSDEIQIPDSAAVISGQGRYLMPGMADMHMHLHQTWTENRWPVNPFRLFLANGVTTIRCFGPLGRTDRYALDLRRDVEQGHIAGPRITTSGNILMIGLKHPQRMVIQQKYQGFDFIKPYSYLTAEEFHEVMTAARQTGMYVAGHIPFQVGLDGILAKGMHEIAHIEELLWELVEVDRHGRFSDPEQWMQSVAQTAFRQLEAFLGDTRQEIEQRFGPRVKGVVDKLKGRGIPVCTTLVVDDVIIQKLFEAERFLSKPENGYLPPSYLETFRQGRDKHQRQFKGNEAFARLKYTLDKILLKALKEAGIPLVVGTDCGTGGMGIVPGFSLHDELEILVQNGFSPYEALACATVEAAKIVGRMNGRPDFGTIEPRKRADLILARRNPLHDVAAIRNPLGVMAAGRWYDHGTLQGMVTPTP